MPKQQINLQNPFQYADIPPIKQFKLWAKTVLDQLSYPCEITIRITSAEEIQDLNQRYRKKNKPTNILSFNYSDDEQELIGDLIICDAVVKQEAVIQQKTITAHYAHLTIHGMLHLLGYDHETAKEAEQMEAMEIILLKKLGFTNPYIEKNHD